MNRAGILYLLVIILFLLGSSAYAQPTYSDKIIDYLWFTNQETTEFGEVLWFYSGDTLSGPVRTNDRLAIKGSPVFYDIVVTAESHLIQGAGYIPEFLGPEPVYDAPPLVDFEFSDAHGIVAQRAIQTGDYWENEFGNGYLQTRVTAEEEGWHIMQWGAGTPFDESVIVNDSYAPYGVRAFYFEGQVEVMGTHVQGQTCIASSGTMYLLDDVLYDGMLETAWTPFLDYDGPERLTLIAPDILVANTPANGQGNGAAIGEWNDHSDKHIRIAAQLITVSGSSQPVPHPFGSYYGFSFENQNNAPYDPNGWDGYWWCDPDGEHEAQPDERGAIFLFGALAQQQRGYVHRSNCGGTGYEKVYAFDDRFPGAHLPGAVETHRVDLSQGDITWQDTSIVLDDEVIRLEGNGLLTLGPGTTIESVNPIRYHLFEQGRIRITGSAEQPVVIRAGAGYDSSHTLTLFENTIVEGEVRHLTLSAPNITAYLPRQLSHLDIEAENEILLSQSLLLPPQPIPKTIRDSHIRGYLHVGRLDTLERTVIEGRIGCYDLCYADRLTLVHNESLERPVWYPDAAMIIWYYESNPQRLIKNTVFQGGYEQLVHAGGAVVDLSYSSWWDAAGDADSLFSDSVNVFEETVVEANPLFWNPEGGDFHLREGSPLIDAGDPNSPADPDGSRADIGAFPYDPTYVDAPETDPETGQPLAFGVENLYPNPFNGMTTLSLTLPRREVVTIVLYDLLGRQVGQLYHGKMQAGQNHLTLNLAQQSSGLYFISVQAGAQRAVAKAMLVK